MPRRRLAASCAATTANAKTPDTASRSWCDSSEPSTIGSPTHSPATGRPSRARRVAGSPISAAGSTPTASARPRPGSCAATSAAGSANSAPRPAAGQDQAIAGVPPPVAGRGADASVTPPPERSHAGQRPRSLSCGRGGQRRTHHSTPHPPRPHLFPPPPTAPNGRHPLRRAAMQAAMQAAVRCGRSGGRGRSG